MSIYREHRIPAQAPDFPIGHDALCAELARLLSPYDQFDLHVDDVLEALATISLDVGHPVGDHRRTFALLAISLGFVGEPLPEWLPQPSMWSVGRNARVMCDAWRADMDEVCP